MQNKTINFIHLWLLLLLLTTTCRLKNSKVNIYVDINAIGTNNGSSWKNAYKSLQDAITDANNIDTLETPIKICVAQGIYRPDLGRGISPGNREATFQLKYDVTLLGGYAGHGALNPNDRDIKKYQSILSGDLNGNDPENIKLETLSSETKRADNSYHVLTGSGTDKTAYIEGFIIKGGNAKDFGGGMIIEKGSPTIKDCLFIENSALQAGGGICNNLGNPTLINCTFKRNASTNSGAICCKSYSNPVITDCVISENFAGENSGGIGCYHSNPHIINCTITGNSSLKDGGGIHCIYGGAIIENCTINNNHCGYYGGGIFCEGTPPPTIINCLIEKNVAYIGGGGIDCFVCSPMINNCTIRNNTSDNGGGGGIRCSGSNPKIKNCIFSGNSTNNNGGGIYLAGGQTTTSTECTNSVFSMNSAVRSGGAIHCDRSNLILTNCIIWNNLASEGSQMSINSGSSIDIKFTDIHTGQEEFKVYNNTSVGFIQKGQEEVTIYYTTSSILMNHNLDEDPLFADPNNGDYHLKSQAGRWNPKIQKWIKDDVTSPCIDAGDPNSPVGLEPLPNGGIIDMGSFGGTAQASLSIK
jgi:hypothetical protein